MNFNDIKLYPISEKISKVTVDDFATFSSEQLYDKFPNILGGTDLKELVSHICLAINNNKPIVIMIGGHVIKCGLAPVICYDLPLKHVAMNGAASIHDFEIALFEETSESVEDNLPEGKFGMWQELLDAYAASIQLYDVDEGLGECLSKYILSNEKCHYDSGSKYNSVLGEQRCDITVHAAYGTDIVHQFAGLNTLRYMRALKADFVKFVDIVERAFDGGIVLNFGCATLLPEVFLKAMNLCVNQGYEVNGMVCANFDMIQQYRAIKNVVERPRLLGATTYNFICQNEIMIPLLAYLVRER